MYSSIALAACNQQTKFLNSIGESIPEGFNVPRSNFGRKDFGNLTLMCIKEYFFERDIEKKKK